MLRMRWRCIRFAAFRGGEVGLDDCGIQVRRYLGGSDGWSVLRGAFRDTESGQDCTEWLERMVLASRTAFRAAGFCISQVGHSPQSTVVILPHIEGERRHGIAKVAQACQQKKNFNWSPTISRSCIHSDWVSLIRITPTAERIVGKSHSVCNRALVRCSKSRSWN